MKELKLTFLHIFYSLSLFLCVWSEKEKLSDLQIGYLEYLDELSIEDDFLGENISKETNASATNNTLSLGTDKGKWFWIKDYSVFDLTPLSKLKYKDNI
jgi:hypothetical protein